MECIIGGKVVGKNSKGEIDMAVVEEYRDTLKETRNQEMLHSLNELRRLGEEIIEEHPDAFSDEDIDRVMSQVRAYKKIL